MKDLLTPSERLGLIESERLDIGKYRTWPRSPECDFVVAIDARPLAVLIDDASCGHRVYEFMTIRRPGDVLPYLWINYVSVEDEVVSWVEQIAHDGGISGCGDQESTTSLPFVHFDGCFAWRGDDMRGFEASWRAYREKPYWIEKMRVLLDLVRLVQGRLREYGDYLIRHEIQLFDEHRHRRDFLREIERGTTIAGVVPRNSSLPNEVLELIRELIGRDDVRSVSCALDDYALWRLLVEKQVRRSAHSGKPPQDALMLSGPDDGLPFVSAEDWGGTIHIPYEGFCDGHILIPPGWRRLNTDQTGPDGRFSWAFGSSECRFVLTAKDHGELGCATRTLIGGWVLYQSKEPGDHAAAIQWV